jgi:hypothetical protein
MKKCTYCGKEYPDEALACAIDGQPLRDTTSMSEPSPPSPPPPATPLPVNDRQQTIDGEHINLLSIFHFVLAGLTLVGILFLFLHYFIMSAIFMNPDFWKSQKSAPPFPQDFLKVFIWFYFFMGAIFAIAGVLNLLSGFFLRQRRHRTFSMVVAGLNCVQIPFGTVLGIFTIMVLSRNSVRERYAG